MSHDHLQIVGNPQNKFVGGTRVSVTRVGGETNIHLLKHSIVSANQYFSLNNFATKFDQINKRNRQTMKILKSDAVAEH